MGIKPSALRDNSACQYDCVILVILASLIKFESHNKLCYYSTY